MCSIATISCAPSAPTSRARSKSARSSSSALRRIDTGLDPVTAERKYRWVKAMAASLPHAVHMYYFPEAAEVIPIAVWVTSG